MEAPLTQRTLLVRERLLERLDARWTVPLLVVTAPAGYGKTTLLTQAIANNSSLDRTDFLLSCGPQHAVASTLGESLCRTLRVAARQSANASVESLADAAVDEIWQQSPGQIALMVDDVHEIPEGSEAAQLLALVMDRMPTNGHLVLAGRRRPPLPLGRREVEGQVVSLDEAELTFTEVEQAEFAALRGVVEANLEDCGGWPALAELYARAGRGVAKEYIAEEVLSELATGRRKQLALLAHLGRFDLEVAQAVLGPTGDVTDFLADVPLVSGPDNGEWAVHSLWQTLLADLVSAQEVAAARRKAAAAMLAHDRAGAAVELLIDAEAWDDLADAVVHTLGAAHPPVARDVLAQWLTQLPHPARASPAGQLLEAVLAAESGFDDALRQLDDCAALFRDRGHVAGELACLAQLGRLAWWSEQHEALAMAAKRVFALEAAGVEAAIPLACLGRSLLFDLVGNNWHQALSELERIPPGSLDEAWQGLVSWMQAILLMALGLAPEAEKAASKALIHSNEFYAPLAEVTRLQAQWYQGKRAQVTEAVPALAAWVKDAGYGNQSALGAAQASVVYAMQGQDELAADYLAQATAAATAAADAPLVATALAVAKAAVAVAAGDEDLARAELASYIERHPIGEGLPVAAQQRHLALFYVLLPHTRDDFDWSELGPVFRLGRDLARAVVAIREERGLGSHPVELHRADLISAHLPPRWVAELGVAAIADGSRDGWDLLEQTWTSTHDRTEELLDASKRSRREAAKIALGRLAVPPDRHLELRLLGPVELTAADDPILTPDWRRERVRGLLAYLVVNGTASRQQLADDLWPSLGPEAQSRNLRVTLTYLLRVLEPQRGPREASFFIRQNGPQLSFEAGEWLTVDLWQFDKLWRQATDANQRGVPQAFLHHALRAVALWRGEPTELMRDQWAIAPFEQRRMRYAELATRAGELLLAQGETERTRALAESAIEAEPWLDKAHQLAILVSRAAGDERGVRQATDRYRETAREMDLP